MYEPDQIIRYLEAPSAVFYVTASLLFFAFYCYYIESIRVGFRTSLFAIPLGANTFNFSHDIIFVSRYDHWFHHVNNWVFKAFWFALIGFLILESIVHIQTLRHGRSVLCPKLSQRQFVAAYVLVQISAVVLFLFLDSLISYDILWMIKFTLAASLNALFVLPFNMSRDCVTSSRLQAGTLLLAVSVLFFGFLPHLSPYFSNIHYQMAGAVVVLVSAVNFFYAVRQPHNRTSAAELYAQPSISTSR
jgi:hypothetical protein